MTNFDPSAIVRVKTENPKRAGSASHERFALYRDGSTVAEFLEAGGTVADLRWDTERGFVELAKATKAPKRGTGAGAPSRAARGASKPKKTG